MLKIMMLRYLRMHLHLENVIPSPMMSELNWDVINATSQENLGSHDGMWNNQDVLNKGLRFENKKDLQYVVRRYYICNNQDLVVVESEPHLWSVKCKWEKGCKWRLRACQRKTQLF